MLTCVFFMMVLWLPELGLPMDHPAALLLLLRAIVPLDRFPVLGKGAR